MRCLRTSRLWLGLRHPPQPRVNPDIGKITTEFTIAQSRLPEPSKKLSDINNDQETKPQPQNSASVTNAPKVPTSINTLPIEIVEHILSELDFWSLLRCRCICRLWNQCITGTSPAIRTALFLPSSKADKITSEPITFNFTVNISELFNSENLDELPLYHELSITPSEIQRLDGRGITVHPLLSKTISDFKIYKYTSTWSSRPAMWMHMLVCYPPVQKMQLNIEYETDILYPDPRLDLYGTHDVLENIRGVGLGELLSGVYEVIGIR